MLIVGDSDSHSYSSPYWTIRKITVRLTRKCQEMTSPAELRRRNAAFSRKLAETSKHQIWNRLAIDRTSNEVGIEDADAPRLTHPTPPPIQFERLVTNRYQP